MKISVTLLSIRSALAFAASLVVIATVGAGLAAGPASAAPSSRAVVVVSGGAAISPFTTPSEYCTSGFKAGSTDSYLRSYLLKQGYRVFTSPAMAGRGPVIEQPAEGGPFGDCPKALPGYMTVNSTGDIELAGVSLSNFINYLGTEYGITEVDFVAHSMGGLYSRSAINYLQQTKSPVKINSLTTLGTPWDGAPFANPTDPAVPISGCDGDPVCIGVLDVFGSSAPVVLVQLNKSQVAALNKFNAGALKKIPVTLIAGNAFTKPGGSSTIWPNDGIVNVNSAFAVGVPNSTINHRRCYLYEGGTHSLYISEAAGLKKSQAITWNPTVGAWVANAIRTAGSAMDTPNRKGCPS